MDKEKKLKEIISLTRSYLKQEKDRGVEFVRKPGVSLETARKKQVENKKHMLEQFGSSVMKCRKCKLSETRIKVVFGQGNPEAKLMFIGGGPGYDEDRQGLPFVGKAGQLLTKIINAMNLKREEVYIANIVKCHPLKDPSRTDIRGNDRAPVPEEIQACMPYLLKQIEIIKPEIIVTLGSPSTRTLLEISGDPSYDKKSSISKIRGQLFDFRGTKLMPTFHPAFLLRDPNRKKYVWEDMKKVMKILCGVLK